MDNDYDKTKRRILFLKEQVERSIDLNYFTVECDKHFTYVIVTAKDIPQTDKERRDKWKDFRHTASCEVCLLMTEEDVKVLNESGKEGDNPLEDVTFVNNDYDKRWQKFMEDKLKLKEEYLRSKVHKTDTILEIINDHDMSILSVEQNDIIYKFMVEYEDAMNINKPLITSGDVNALEWHRYTREMLIKFLDILYKQVKVNEN